MMDANAQSTPLAQARELDAAGRHDEAINQLAIAAQRGDVDATTQLAKRLIVGDRAPRLRPQGIGLLRDAVAAGGAEAADRLAVIAAAGADGRPDWRAALRLVGLAAERGWKPARGQLEVLASMLSNETGTSLPAADAKPARLAAVIAEDAHLRQLLVPAAGSVLHASPRLCMFPEFVSTAACDWLIDSARGRLVRARVYDAFKHTDFVDESRTNSAAIFHGMDADLVHLMVQARMAAACEQPVSHMEASTVLHYATGETIGNHYDFVDPEHPNYDEEIRRFGNRVVTFLIYLNAGYGGGETAFPRLDIRHFGERGEGMFFVNTLEDGRANLQTLHSGRPPTHGEKWVFSQFVRNRSQL